MAGNSIGQQFKVTTFGESHGPALGCIIDGCPPGLEIDLEDLQGDLNRRKPGTSRYTTPRKEDDEVKILSGIFYYEIFFKKINQIFFYFFYNNNFIVIKSFSRAYYK